MCSDKSIADRTDNPRQRKNMAKLVGQESVKAKANGDCEDTSEGADPPENEEAEVTAEKVHSFPCASAIAAHHPKYAAGRFPAGPARLAGLA